MFLVFNYSFAADNYGSHSFIVSILQHHYVIPHVVSGYSE